MFTGVMLLVAGIFASPCGFVSYVIPYPPFVFSEWSGWVLAIFFFAPLLLVPASILCLDAGQRIRRMRPPGRHRDDS